MSAPEQEEEEEERLQLVDGCITALTRFSKQHQNQVGICFAAQRPTRSATVRKRHQQTQASYSGTESVGRLVCCTSRRFQVPVCAVVWCRPVDGETEPAGALFDPVLGFAVQQLIGRDSLDGQDDVAHAQVSAGRLAAWSHLEGDVEWVPSQEIANSTKYCMCTH